MTEFEIEKLANVISKQTGIVLKKGSFWGIIKEGQSFVLVYNIEDLFDISEDAIIGIVFHEALHIKYKSHLIFKKKNFPSKIWNYREQLLNLLNVLENWRIERKGEGYFPNLHNFFLEAFKQTFKNRIILDKIDSSAFTEYLDRMRFEVPLTKKDFIKRVSTPKLKELQKDIEKVIPMLNKYCELKMYKDRIGVIKDIWEVYKKYLKKEPKPEREYSPPPFTPFIIPIPYDILKTISNSKAIENQFKKLVVEQKRVEYPNMRSGKLYDKKLYRIGSKDFRIFQKKHFENKDYPEFSVWLDTSGSMAYQQKIHYALSGLISISEGLQKLGIRFTLGHFAKEARIIKDYVSGFKKRHIEEIYNHFGGGTHEYKAIRLGYKNFSGKTQKKVILVITDGISESQTNLIHTLNVLKDKAKVIGIGIGLIEEDLKLFPNRVLASPQNLPIKLFQILKRELLTTQ